LQASQEKVRVHKVTIQEILGDCCVPSPEGKPPWFLCVDERAIKKFSACWLRSHNFGLRVISYTARTI
jgi:hypothetical protein